MAVKVDGVEIPEQKILSEIDALRPAYVEYVQKHGGEPSEEQLRDWAVENLVEGVLLRNEAIKTQPVPNEERVRKELESDDYSAFPEEQRAEEARVALQQRRLLREMRKGVKPPSDEEVRAFYTENASSLMLGEGVQLGHICRLVTPATRANEFLELLRIKSEIEQGQIGWFEAVRAYSDTVERDLGYFDFSTVRRGELPEAVEEALFALEPGAISDVIDLDIQTLHLFRLLHKEESRQVSHDEIAADLKTVLFERAYQEALDAHLDALKATAVIEGWSLPEKKEPTAAQ